MLMQMDRAAWAEIGVTSALQCSRILACVEQARYDAPPMSVIDTRRQRSGSSSSSPSSTMRAAAADAAGGAVGGVYQTPDVYRSPTRARNRAQLGAEHPKCHPVRCRCVVQNLIIHRLESQTFEAKVKFEASWEDKSTVLRLLYDANLRLSDRIIKEECSHNALVVRGADGYKTKQLFAPRLVFKNRVKVEDCEEWCMAAHRRPNHCTAAHRSPGHRTAAHRRPSQ